MHCLVVQEILQTRFPMPRYIITDQGGSQVSNYSEMIFFPRECHSDMYIFSWLCLLIGSIFALESEPLSDAQHHVWMGSSKWHLPFLLQVSNPDQRPPREGFWVRDYSDMVGSHFQTCYFFSPISSGGSQHSYSDRRRQFAGVYGTSQEASCF